MASCPSGSPPKRRNRSASRSSRSLPTASRRTSGTFPGSISLRVATHLAVVRDILDSMGTKRLPAHPDRQRPRRQRRGAAVPRRSGWPTIRDAAGSSSTTGGTRRAPGPRFRRSTPASHGSWMENFPWTRPPGVQRLPHRSPWSIWRSPASHPGELPCAVPGRQNYGGDRLHSVRMRTCWPSGRWASRRRPATEPGGDDGTGRRRHRRYCGCSPGAGRAPADAGRSRR